MGESWKSRGPFLVLLALRTGPKHGYEIASWLKDQTDGFFSLSFGALYPILHQMEKDGFVDGSWEEVGATKRRKVYTLTARGREALGEERERYEAYVGAFKRLLGSSR